MGIWKALMYNHQGFTASLPPENIPPDFIKYLYIALRADQNGTTALTVANYLAGLANIRVKLGGHDTHDLSYADLLALNLKWEMLQHNDEHAQVGGGDDYYACITTKLPLFFVKKGREATVALEYAAITNADGNVMNLAYDYVDSPAGVPDWPYGDWHYEIDTFPYTGAASVRTNISRQGCLLVGLLTYSPGNPKATDCVGAGTSPEASELKLIVDNREVYADNWRTRDSHSIVNLADDTTIAAVTAAYYGWIDLTEQPWDAEKIWCETSNVVTTEGTAGVGAARLIPVYIAP